jgi:hypothetical protein
MTHFPLRRAANDPGGVAERSKAADCKSADVRLRRFESYPLHQRFGGTAGAGAGAVVPGARPAEVGQGLGSGWRAWNAGVAQW